MEIDDLRIELRKKYAEWFAGEYMPPNADAFMKKALEEFGRLAYYKGYLSCLEELSQKQTIPQE